MIAKDLPASHIAFSTDENEAKEQASLCIILSIYYLRSALTTEDGDTAKKSDRWGFYLIAGCKPSNKENEMTKTL